MSEPRFIGLKELTGKTKKNGTQKTLIKQTNTDL
jgi:hypothetical protein